MVRVLDLRGIVSCAQVKRGESGESGESGDSCESVNLMDTSAKLELLPVDLEGLDPVVQGRRWNAKFRRRA